MSGATIGRVSRPRGALTKEQERRISRAYSRQAEAERAYRAEVLAAMSEGASFAEMSTFTGLSTNTLQRWKREAGAPSPWVAFPGKAPVCRACGADWRPVRRGECGACGDDGGPVGAEREAGKSKDPHAKCGDTYGWCSLCRP